MCSHHYTTSPGCVSYLRGYIMSRAESAKRYREKNKDKIREYQQKYYQTHKDTIIEQAQCYKESHKDSELYRMRRRAYSKNYYAENIVEKRAWARQYFEEHRERANTSHSHYQKTPHGRFLRKIVSQRRRALKNVSESFSSANIFERDGYVCQICGRKTRTDYKNVNHPLYPNLDHIIPLTRGGEHTRKNTQCLCHLCNLKKGNRDANCQLLLFG